jgi:hypothetical protein
MLDEIIIEEDQVANLTRSILRFLHDKDAEVRFYKQSTDIWEEDFLSKYLTETIEYFGNIFKAQIDEKFQQKNLIYFKKLGDVDLKEERIFDKIISGTPIAFNTGKYFLGFYKSGEKYVFGSINTFLENILFERGQEYNLWIATCFNYVNKIIKDRNLRFIIVDYLLGRQTSNIFKFEYKPYLEEGLAFLRERKKKLRSKKLIGENKEKELIYKTLITNAMQREKIVSFSEKIFYNIFLYYKKILKSYISGMFEIEDRYYDETYDRLLFYRFGERKNLIDGVLGDIEDEEEKHYRRLLKLKMQEMRKYRGKLMEKYKISQPTDGEISNLLKKTGFLEEH